MLQKYRESTGLLRYSAAVLGIILCAAILIPQTGQMIVAFASRITGKCIVINDLLPAAFVYICILCAFLAIFCFKVKIPPISPTKKTFIYKTAEIILVCLYSCMLIFLARLSNAVWVDEVYSIVLTRLSWKDMMTFLPMDVHPPFYFIALKTGIFVFGDSIAVMKMISVFPAILVAIFVTLFLRKEFSDKAAVVFLLSCIASAVITLYAIEIRMYSWGLFFITMMAISAWYFFKHGQKRWWTSLLLCAVFAAYTHTYAMLAAAIGYLLLFFCVLKYRRERILAMLIMAIAGSLLFLPWLFVLLEQFSRASDNFFIGPITLSTIGSYIVGNRGIFSVENIFVSFTFCLIFCSVVVFFLAKKNKCEKDIFALGGLCCAVLLVLSGIIVSFAIHPLFLIRYAVPTFGLVWLFFAIECAAIRQKQVFVFICVALVSIGIVSFSLSAYREIEENKMSNEFYTYLSERMQPNDAIVVFVDNPVHPHEPKIMNYLFPNQDFTSAKSGDAIKLTTSNSGTDYIINTIFGKSYIEYNPGIYDNRTVWTIVTEETETDLPEGAGELCGSFSYNRYNFDLYGKCQP